MDQAAHDLIKTLNSDKAKDLFNTHILVSQKTGEDDLEQSIGIVGMIS